jgi:hypothetical protein
VRVDAEIADEVRRVHAGQRADVVGVLGLLSSGQHICVGIANAAQDRRETDGG